jgi:hypothetical protein
MTLSFAQSGSSPASFSLADVKDLATKHGVTRADGSADLDAFFKLYGVKALSTFKAKWSTEKLLPPGDSPPAALAPDTPALGAGTTKVRVSKVSAVAARPRCSRNAVSEVRELQPHSDTLLPELKLTACTINAHAELRARACAGVRAAAAVRVRRKERRQPLGQGAQVASHPAPRWRIHQARRLVPPLRGCQAGALTLLA